MDRMENYLDYQPNGNWELVDMLDEGGYDWSAAAVWRRTTDNTYWYATDGGCSCNSAFDNTTADQLTRLTRESFQKFTEEVKEAMGDYSSADAIQKFIHHVSQVAEIYPGVIGW